MEVTLFGLFQSPVSWSKVLREIAIGLYKLGFPFKIWARKGFKFNPLIELPKILKKVGKSSNSPDVLVSFVHPLLYRKLPGKFHIAISVYENSGLPKNWVENMNKYADIILVPSHLCKIFYELAGVKADKIRIMPFGTNIIEKKEYLQFKEKKFNFLMITTPHIRKGIDIAIRAYLTAFKSNEPVRLIIKMPFESCPQNRLEFPWENGGTDLMIKKILKYHRKNIPEIKLLIWTSTDEELQKWYNSAHCYIQPSRSEAFGLAILDAFSHKLPTIVSGWGGHWQYCNFDNCLPIKFKWRKSYRINYDFGIKKAIIAEPDYKHLAFLMRLVYENYHYLDNLRKNALLTAQKYSWLNTAKILANLIENEI